MERSHIAILESFPLISVIIPYYGFTHWGFLLLSALSRKTRSILMKNYEVFRTIMLQYSKEREIEDNGERSLLVLLPADLFKFNISISAENLIELARKLKEGEGCYFGERYMSNQICISKIYVYSQDIKSLYSHVDLLKEIKVLDNTNLEVPLSTSLLKQIVIRGIDIFNKERNIDEKYRYFEDKNCNEINPIFKEFCMFSFIYLDSNDDPDYLIEKLKHAKISEVEEFNIEIDEAHNLEKVLNSENYNFKIKNLSLEEIEYSLLKLLETKNTLLKSCKILQLSECQLYSMFKILSALPKNMTVKFGQISLENYNLKFENTKAFFKSDDELDAFSCKEIKYKLNYSCSKELVFIDEKYILIRNEIREVSQFEKVNKPVRFKQGFLPKKYNNSNRQIIVPISDLVEIKLDYNTLLCLLNVERNRTGFASLSPSTNVLIKLENIDDALEFMIICKFIPNHSQLGVDLRYYNKYKHRKQINEIEHKKEIAKFFEIASNFRIKYLQCSGEDEKI